MKKIIFFLVIFIASFSAAVLLFIPSVEKISCSAKVKCPQSAVQRFLVYKSNWGKWWPGNKLNDTLYTYGNFTYSITKIFIDGFETQYMNTGDTLMGTLSYQPISADSTLLSWESNIPLSNNPFTRFFQNMVTGQFQANATGLLAGMQSFFNKEENVYGFKVNMQKVQNSSLIATNKVFNHYPTVQEVYAIIASLKGYIASKKGEQVNYPMLNVNIDDSINYRVMVAIPVKNDLPAYGSFQLKKMVLGNILMARVQGGIKVVQQGEEELTNYLEDYHKTSPAIPYQLLVTDRLQQRDSTQWVTELYYPVFH